MICECNEQKEIIVTTNVVTRTEKLQNMILSCQPQQLKNDIRNKN